MTKDRLFGESIHEFAEEKLSSARASIRAISEEDLLSRLNEELDEIAARFKFVVATLNPEGRRGKRRKESREDNYGRNVTVDVIDVSIPYAGYPKSFFLAPSGSIILKEPVRYTAEALVATFYEDDNLDSNVNTFIERVSENLNRLGNEMEALRPRIRDAAAQAAQLRIAEINDRRDLDAKYSFPID